MSSSVLRRYTPPTCTLEIAAIGSALSRWTDQAVLKNLRFELSFDDPTLTSDQQMTIRGDRNQLESLWEAVSSYVQTILLQPLEALRQHEPIDQLSASQLSASHWVEENGSAGHLHEAKINLQPKGRLRHELHLGTLASEEATVIPLTTLQLFDLANALDEYHAEALTLPSLGRSRWLKLAPTSWKQVAVAAVLVVGVSVPIVKFVTDLSAPQMATTASTKDVEISTAPRSGDLPAPLSPGTTPPPLTLTPLKPAVPLPPVGTTVFPAPVPGAASAPPLSSAPSAPVETVPVQPNTIEIPGEPSFPEIPSRPLEAPTTEAPPRLEGTQGFDSASQAVPQPSPESSNLTNELASAGLAPPEPESALSSPLSANGRSATPASNNQADEVKTYFQQNWQPPEGLVETLEYRLLLNPDGSLQRILPLGDDSANFLDRTNMPLLGEPFVSPTTGDQQPQIRVVLEPDGRVQTFLEYAD
ncbi:MAG: DUF4335 domain-containing protein [Timaviella obliquedivisa GSE-PSE-MK23-08B]|jgi:hypothetical protein|nr:DUF4335 domain-containing protein [Timaviella obliquedivisa GSE-PSE-MK23-08B]